MTEPSRSNRIKQMRGEVLVALKMLYPAALQGEQLLRALLAIFPQLEWEHLRRDLAYLLEKGYVARVLRYYEASPDLAPWRKRHFRLTAAGVEIADRCVQDPALEV